MTENIAFGVGVEDGLRIFDVFFASLSMIIVSEVC